MITKKIVLIGDFSTGKTSLIRKYVDNQFSDEYLTTIGVKISKKIVNLSTTNDVQLLIWDIEGNTDVKAMNPAYIMGANGIIIVADSTREKSIDNIKDHLQTCSKLLKKVPIIIALNKSDLLNDDFIMEQLLTNLKNLYSEIDFIYPTSAKNGRNVELIFTNLAQSMLEISR